MNTAARPVQDSPARLIAVMQDALARGDLPTATHLAAQARALLPDLALPLLVLGQAALAAGRPDEAIAALSEAVERSCDYLGCGMLAMALHAGGDLAGAEARGAQAIGLVPEEAGALFVLAGMFESIGGHGPALGLFQRCLVCDPGHDRARHRAGMCRLALGDAAGAVDDLWPGMADAGASAEHWCDLSAALSACGRFEDARAAASMAVVRDPSSWQGLNNLGHALVQLNRSAEALPYYARAASVAPDNPVVRFGQSIALLKSGHLCEGWREYEWRWRDCQRPRTDLTQPAWQGEDLRGRTILVHMEQGFGDAIQFARYLPLLAQLGATVIVQMPGVLHRLFETIDGVAAVYGTLLPGTAYDFHCPIASLPLFFDARPGNVPDRAYIARPGGDGVARANALRARAVAGHAVPPLVVGIVWAGEARPHDVKANLVDRRRSATLADFAPLFGIENVRFVSFQYGALSKALDAGPHDVIDAMDGVRDFADTAALLGGVDLLISVDTSIVHLAGAMGVPVWMLSRFDGCWRWLEQVEDSFWYPTMWIFRQQRPQDWGAPIEKIGHLLRRWVEIYTQSPRLEPGAADAPGSDALCAEHA